MIEKPLNLQAFPAAMKWMLVRRVPVWHFPEMPSGLSGCASHDLGRGGCLYPARRVRAGREEEGAMGRLGDGEMDFVPFSERECSLSVTESPLSDTGSSLPKRESSLPERECSLPEREISLPEKESSLPEKESSLPERESSLPETESSPSETANSLSGEG